MHPDTPRTPMQKAVNSLSVYLRSALAAVRTPRGSAQRGTFAPNTPLPQPPASTDPGEARYRMQGVARAQARQQTELHNEWLSFLLYTDLSNEQLSYFLSRRLLQTRTACFMPCGAADIAVQVHL